jgi:FixJ family two-component response regulator
VSAALQYRVRERLDTLVSRHPTPKYCILHRMSKRTKPIPEVRPTTTKPLVSVVDDDESVRESLPDLLKELGFAVKAFASAEEFLKSNHIAATRCLLLDVAMPGMSGPELQRELAARGEKIGIIFITAQADEAVRKQLIARGAVDCLLKPFSEQQLRAALDAALQKN